MQRFFAIDWDERECRYAAAEVQKNKIHIRQAGTFPLLPNTAEEPKYEENEDDDEDAEVPPVIVRHPNNVLTDALHECRKTHHIPRSPMLVSLGRNKLEWLQTALPPCSEEELPLLLKNQVLREIPACNDFDIVDYLVLSKSSEGYRLLALMFPLIQQQSMYKQFRSSGYPPQMFGYRAVNAAETAFRALESAVTAVPCLIVNAAGHDADLILADKNRITAVRSFRLSAENRPQYLAEEILRSLSIGLSEAAPVAVENIIFFGNETENELTSTLSGQGFKLHFVNPFAAPDIACDAEPEMPEKYAAVIGSILWQLPVKGTLAEVRKDAVINFLHPKEAPKPPNYARPVLLACVLLLILAAGFYQWNRGAIRNMESQLAKIKQEHQQTAADLMQLQPGWNVLRQTQYWESQNVLWLDVLRDLSSVFPADTDLVVTQMTFTTGPINNNVRLTGSIVLTGMVRDPSVLLQLQRTLQTSGQYMMQNQTPSPNPAGGGYPWLFRATVYRIK